MSTPVAPDLTINVSLDKSSYATGDPIVVTADAMELTNLTVTVSGTTAAGVTANGSDSASVTEPPAGTVSFGVTDNLGTAYNVQSTTDNTVVYNGTIGTNAPAS